MDSKFCKYVDYLDCATSKGAIATLWEANVPATRNQRWFRDFAVQGSILQIIVVSPWQESLASFVFFVVLTSSLSMTLWRVGIDACRNGNDGLRAERNFIAPWFPSILVDSNLKKF